MIYNKIFLTFIKYLTTLYLHKSLDTNFYTKELLGSLIQEKILKKAEIYLSKM